ncbi:MAG: hypothetical protein IPN73_14820 [Saprospiraceae bacterium]|nr:hypothetical protein [Saprospiraceae bacterium]MBK7790323.1 hypothetical protein [Saprospiraceae bacterium]MBK8112254.1 hypothetical protein [Saprospiraceae bacterium]MBK8851403.1 hypothetical protein [Saprospiraceae bacterium]MBL0084945.1 hypothetical protein [Saprospiraceae bacterium]
MIQIHPQYITDHNGKKLSVVLPIKDFKDMLEKIEELEDIKLYDESKKSNDPSIPIEEAFQMIEENRK